MQVTGAPLWPLLVYFGAVLAIVAGMVGVSWVLGERHHRRATPATREPYESGIVPSGGSRVHVAPQFYLVAMLFVIFDLEAVFLIAWATAVPETGWAGFWAAAVFVAVLAAALVYEWRVGALDFAPRGRLRSGGDR